MGATTIEALSTRAAEPAVSTPPERTGRSRRFSITLALAAVTCLAAFLRFHAIAAKSFWIDEGMSVEYALLPWKAFLHTLWARELNMAPYYFLLKGWLAFGRTDGFARSLSALFSIATVPVIFAIGRRLFDERTGIVAAFLISIHALHVRYAQEARSYAMVVFLCALASWLLIRNLQEPDTNWKPWAAYTAVCALAVYTHFYAGLVVVAHLAALAAVPRQRIPWKAVVSHLFVFSALVAPVAVFVHRNGTEPIGWVQPVNGPILRHFGYDLAGNYGRTLLILYVIILGIALAEVRRGSMPDEPGKSAFGYTFLFAWLFVPVAIVLLASLHRPLFVPRYLNPCLPAAVLLAAAAIAAPRHEAMRALLFAAITTCSVLGTLSYYRQDFDVSRQDWRVAADYIARHAQEGDSIYFYQGIGQPPFDFYYRCQQSAARVWPKSLNFSYATAERRADYHPISGTGLSAAAPVGDRVWLVFLLPSGPGGMPDTLGAKVRDWFAVGRQRVEVQRLYPIDIVLFAGHAPSAPAGTAAK